MKNWITITLFFLVLNGYAQNVEFKAANFKNDKEGLKKAEDAISKGDESLVLGKEAVKKNPKLAFVLNNIGTTKKKAKDFQGAMHWIPLVILL